MLNAGWAIRAQNRANQASREAKLASAAAIKSSSEATQYLAEAQGAQKNAEAKAAQLAASLHVLSSVNKKDVQTAVDAQSSSTLLPRVYMQIVNENDRAYANQIKDRLTAAGVLVLGIQYVANAKQPRTDVRYYRTTDEPEAQKIVNLLKDAGAAPLPPKYLPGFEDSTRVRQNHFEVWLRNGIGGAPSLPSLRNIRQTLREQPCQILRPNGRSSRDSLYPTSREKRANMGTPVSGREKSRKSESGPPLYSFWGRSGLPQLHPVRLVGRITRGITAGGQSIWSPPPPVLTSTAQQSAT